MFIRRVKKQRSKSSKIFYQYTLSQASRIKNKVRQRSVLYLGSDKELDDKESRDLVLLGLKSKIFKQPELVPTEIPQNLLRLIDKYYEKYLIKYGQDAVDTDDTPVSIPPAPSKANYEEIDLDSVDTHDVKNFGAEHLCIQVLEKLQLRSCFSLLGMKDKEIKRAIIAIAARAIYASSEHKTADILAMNSALTECLQYDDTISYKQLYKIADKLYASQQQIDSFLYNRIVDLFNLEDRLVIYDISNTYFETSKKDSAYAQYGRSKEKRSDCPIVVFTGVINREGFIRHSRIYEGSQVDHATLEDMISDLEAHAQEKGSKATKNTVVMDAGFATEDNLSYLRHNGYDYICVSRRRLRDFPTPSAPVKIKSKTDPANVLSLQICTPEEEKDQWMYVQSTGKQMKEQSITTKLTKRFEEELENIAASFHKKRGIKKIEKVWERIGRAKQKYVRVSSRYTIDVKAKDGKAVELKWIKKKDKVKEDKGKGVYFIRTSYKNIEEKKLWDIYNTIREVEATFRSLKSDLKIRPVYHQTDGRIASHIYMTILAYQLVNTIRYMLKQNGIHMDWQNIVRIMSTQTLQTTQMKTKTKQIQLRKPSKPIEMVQKIYSATDCTKVQTPVRKDVVYH